MAPLCMWLKSIGNYTVKCCERECPQQVLTITTDMSCSLSYSAATAHADAHQLIQPSAEYALASRGEDQQDCWSG